jgi:hypothetical protein
MGGADTRVGKQHNAAILGIQLLRGSRGRAHGTPAPKCTAVRGAHLTIAVPGGVMLRYCCPITNQMVQTSIVASKHTIKRLAGYQLSVWCPHCQKPHRIDGKDAIYVDPPIAA